MAQDVPEMDVDIEVKDLPAQHVLMIRERASGKGLGAAMRGLYPVIAAYLEKRGVQPAGPPFAVYHSYGDEEVDFEAGLPVAEPVGGEGRINASELPGGPAAVATLVGPYATIGRLHEALDALVHERGTGHAGPPREVYWSGPGDEPDSSKWRTDVIYPLGS
jgi:effector-binding domain-containing protein